VKPQHCLTVITTVRDGCIKPLEEILAQIASDVRGNSLCPFGKAGGVHYARWVLLEPTKTPEGDQLPGELAFVTVYDQCLDEHLDELVRVGVSGIDAIYSKCDGYPAESVRSDSSRKKYFITHSVPIGALYSAHAGRELAQILLEDQVRECLEKRVDALCLDRTESGFSAGQIHEDLRKVIDSNQQFLDASRYASNSSAWPSQRIAKLTFAGIGMVLALAVFPLTLFLFLIWLVILRYHETRDESAQANRSLENLNKLASEENVFEQNQITVVTWVKLGWFRRLNLRLVLFGANFVSTVLLWTKRDFFGLQSIHHAQWVLIDNNRRLVFFSNFDNSWESYLGDFVDKAHIALTAVWSNCIGFPRTWFLMFGGASFEEQFKDLVRDHQIPTQVWYAAYPNLTVPNVNDASDINIGLHRSPGSSSARWLSLL
jgi:hypothetical protein